MTFVFITAYAICEIVQQRHNHKCLLLCNNLPTYQLANLARHQLYFLQFSFHFFFACSSSAPIQLCISHSQAMQQLIKGLDGQEEWFCCVCAHTCFIVCKSYVKLHIHTIPLRCLLWGELPNVML